MTTRHFSHAMKPALSLSTSWRVGWRVVSLRVSALRNGDGSPRFEIFWQPDRPQRLHGPQIQAYDSGYRRAKAQLLEQLAHLQAPSTAASTAAST